MTEETDANPTAKLIDLRDKLRAVASPAEAARQQIVEARHVLDCTQAEFADRLNQLVDWDVTAELVTCWENEITPPGDVVMAAQSLVGTAGPSPSVERDLAGVEAVFRTRSEFMAAMPPESLFDNAQVIEAAGLSHNLLCQHYPTSKLVKLLTRGAEVEILFLEPNGEAIAQREEEEQFEIGRLSMLTDLNISTLVTQVRRKLDPGALPRLRIGTYDQTIRLNLIFLDDEVCICQPYLHAARGVDAPTLIIRNTEQDGVYESLRSCYRWLRSNANFR